jgi:pyruvate/2-oxoacid:ferredoxin oxidoreductase beta subunit/Pyruvate/2-oxoacid:ferredoxin oxidoreductase gamma subunit
MTTATLPMLRPDGVLPYCKGCSHGLVLRALGRALDRAGRAPTDVAVVTDIGCVGLADAQFVGPHTIHTTHGRSSAFATGMALADSVLGAGRLKPIVMIGDGGAMIGINHLVNAALLNPDVTVLVHNNFLFGMTGGQNSAFSPLDFVTSTTRGGNIVPPLDLARVLTAARAPFVARRLATDRDLADTIARAIEHPGFAVVEVLELCTAYASRWNELTGTQLREVADRAGYELGVLRDEPRPTYASALGARSREAAVARNGTQPPRFVAAVDEPIGVVIAGSAGEHVQSSASLFAKAAMLAGLHVTQKNDNPVTHGTGFSVSEVMLSPEPILFTGIERVDAMLVVSADGMRELRASGAWDRVDARTVLIADDTLELPDVPCPVARLPLRRQAGAKTAAIGAIALLLDRTGVIPLDALWAVAEAEFPADAAATRAKVSALMGAG